MIRVCWSVLAIVVRLGTDRSALPQPSSLLGRCRSAAADAGPTGVRLRPSSRRCLTAELAA